MELRNAWYAGAWSGELRKQPLGRALLGHRIAFFRGSDGKAYAVKARCPHRGADLSQGRCVDGTVECPFHGWRFDTRGRCVSIPSQPDGVKIPVGARLDSFAVVERDGVVWLRADGGHGPNAPPEPPARIWSGRRVVLPPTLVQGFFLRLLENALDTAHNPFIHRGVFGPHVDRVVARQKIHVHADGLGLRAEDDPASPWRPTGSFFTGVYGLVARILGQTPPLVRRATFDLGGTITTHVEAASGRWDAFTLHLTPSTPGQTWIFYESTRTRFPLLAGDPIQRTFMRRILEGGRRETSLIVNDPPDTGLEISVESDRVSLDARRLYCRPMSQKEGA